MNRRNFTKAVSVEIVKRATKQIGDDPDMKATFCEECGELALRFQIDHIDPDAMQIDKSKPLTAEEGQLLCRPCHREKSKVDVANIARAVRREGRHIGAVKPKGEMPRRPKPEPKPKRFDRTPLAPRVMFKDARG